MKLRKIVIAVSTVLFGNVSHHLIAEAAPVTHHPRLWITQEDIPRLRAWAVPTNPMYTKGLLPAVRAAIQVYDNQFFPNGAPNPSWPDTGGALWPKYPTESYALLFAFMSHIDPDPAARIQHAQRARNLLMYAINEAAKGVLDGAPFRDARFAVLNRSTAYGEGFPLTVDWIYNAKDTKGQPILTADDKATIRKVFLRWAHDNCYGYPLTMGIAWPMGKPVPTNDPALLTLGQRTLAWATNNYYEGQLRQLVLMSLSMDEADDPPISPEKPALTQGNTLRSYYQGPPALSFINSTHFGKRPIPL